MATVVGVQGQHASIPWRLAPAALAFLLFSPLSAGQDVGRGTEGQAPIANSTFLRCFFVYAATAQVARDYPNRRLFEWMHGRMAWTAGYIAGKRQDAEFASYFNAHVEDGKREAEKVDKALKQALREGSNEKYLAAMQPTFSCDRAMGHRFPANPPPVG